MNKSEKRSVTVFNVFIYLFVFLRLEWIFVYASEIFESISLFCQENCKKSWTRENNIQY